MNNIEAFHEYIDHCNGCPQCAPAAADAEPQELCDEGRLLWEAFQELQTAGDA